MLPTPTEPISEPELQNLEAMRAVVGPEPLQVDAKNVVRPSGDAEVGNWMVASFRWQEEAECYAALHNSFPDLAASLRAAWARVEELENEGEARSANILNLRDGLVEWVKLSTHNRTSTQSHRDRTEMLIGSTPMQCLAARDARMRREGAIAALESAAEYMNGRAFHVQSPMEAAYLDSMRHCQSEAERLKAEG